MADTIAAISTPPGSGGIGIVKISGSLSGSIAKKMTGLSKINTRKATLCSLFSSSGLFIDKVIVIFFANPNSYTGEDVIEFQCHGGVLIVNKILTEVIHLGARIADPGEFTKRAYLNNKIDLSQAAAVSAMIHARSEQALVAAQNSFSGVFSKKINILLDNITQLRMYVEAAIDFSDEDINFIDDSRINILLRNIGSIVDEVLRNGKNTQLLTEGINIVIVGKPNVGKSSLLNYLVGDDVAIVSDIAGTTRDVIKQQINLDGLLLNVLDTAGIRDSSCEIEVMGIKRATENLAKADLILLMHDQQDDDISIIEKLVEENKSSQAKTMIVSNKIDLIENNSEEDLNSSNKVKISLKNNIGLDAFKEKLKYICGYQVDQEDTVFFARSSHINIIENIKSLIMNGEQAMIEDNTIDILAFELQQAQMLLSEITGEFTSDDLLGEIFTNFCIGK